MHAWPIPGCSPMALIAGCILLSALADPQCSGDERDMHDQSGRLPFSRSIRTGREQRFAELLDSFRHVQSNA